MIEVSKIDALLPQTQCGECGYAGCLPYAKALAQGLATIDRCPPGGIETTKALGRLLAIEATPYLTNAAANTRPPAQAIIREAECIGCTKCIQACPVDAIVGSAKRMHSIISHECTGCGLCIDPCPVDCIDLVPVTKAHYDKALARQRFQAKQQRLCKEVQDSQQRYQQQRQLRPNTAGGDKQDIKAKQAYILQALARVEAKKKHG